MFSVGWGEIARMSNDQALVESFDTAIRRVWHDDRWFYSVVDVIALLVDAPVPRNYWADMKRQVQSEGFVELLVKIQQLRMPAADGKLRLTDAADEETLLRIIQSIPSPKAEPIKQWLARVGAERLEEMRDPALAADRLQRLYRQQGYPEDWIELRMQTILDRDELTGEWRERGAKEGREFAILTDTIHEGAFDIKTADHKKLKSIKPRQDLRDNMTRLELALINLAEVASTELHRTRDSQGLSELQRDAKEAGRIGGNARRDVEETLGRPVVSSENRTTLTDRQPKFSPTRSSGA
jgi:DNA-damage-inducible protein D